LIEEDTSFYCLGTIVVTIKVVVTTTSINITVDDRHESDDATGRKIHVPIRLE
jgi:hypothetical protein